jgi:uncharacterized membrane protein SirB2
MIEFHPYIRALHIACVLASVSLFAVRGTLVLAGHGPLAMRPLLRWPSYAIDTLLLTAALMLFTILPGAVFANHWLSVKLVLLVGYIVLGHLALRRARSTGARAGLLLAALGVFALMYGIARAHHPLGWLRQLID